MLRAIEPFFTAPSVAWQHGTHHSWQHGQLDIGHLDSTGTVNGTVRSVYRSLVRYGTVPVRITGLVDYHAVQVFGIVLGTVDNFPFSFPFSFSFSTGASAPSPPGAPHVVFFIEATCGAAAILQ